MQTPQRGCSLEVSGVELKLGGTETGRWRERGGGRDRDTERDILLNKQYMFISRGELDSRKM